MSEVVQESAYQVDSLISEDIDAYLAKHQHKTCCASSRAARWTTASRP
jgi:hypothetical protein